MESIIWLVVGAIVGIAVGFIVTKYLANSSTKRAALSPSAAAAAS